MTSLKRIILPDIVFKLVKSFKYLPWGQFVFHVPLNYSKPQIKYYLENLYNMKVLNIHTMIYRGKTKKKIIVPRTVFRKYELPYYKKAIVTLDMSVETIQPNDLRKQEDDIYGPSEISTFFGTKNPVDPDKDSSANANGV